MRHLTQFTSMLLAVSLLLFVSLCISRTDSQTYTYTPTQTYTREITQGIPCLQRCSLWPCVFRSSPLMWHLVPPLKAQEREPDQMSRRNQMRLFVGAGRQGSPSRLPRLVSPCPPLTLHDHPLKPPLLWACHAPTCDLTRPKKATSMFWEPWGR